MIKKRFALINQADCREICVLGKLYVKSFFSVFR